MMGTVDFTASPRVPGRAYSGANGKKIAVSLQDGVWLLKFPPNAAEVPNDLSYSNSCFSEHIGCTIFRALGIDTQETCLGTFRNGREHVVCACRDFTVPAKRLIDFCSVKNTVLDTGSGGSGTELADVLGTIDGQQFVDPVTVKRRFWEMFVVDALLGNFDRHNGNWGFLVDDRTGVIDLAPVFDCGSCLLPQADERIQRAMLEKVEELNARIYAFPNSMLKIDGRKINYSAFFQQSADADFRRSCARLAPAIANLDFAGILAEMPYLTDLQRNFYRVYLEARRDALFAKPSESGVTRRTAIGGLFAAGFCLGANELFATSVEAEPHIRARPWAKDPSIKIPLLGFGMAERFPQQRGKGIGTVDEALGGELVNYAISNGVNWFDTGYNYHKGASERFLGKVLKGYPRDSFILSDKMPTWLVHKKEDGPRIFAEQLERCQVRYFDFYLMHSIGSRGTYEYVYKKLGVLDYLREEKKKGRIRHLGLSFHGKSDVLELVLNENPDLEVCMLMLNALEFRWNPDARKLPEIAAKHGVTVLVMEPLAGGRAAALRGKPLEIIKGKHPDHTPAQWAFRFAADLPGVACLLSGMHKLAYLKENIRTLSEEHYKPLDADERKVYDAAVDAYMKHKSIPCTGCRYCVPCPYGVKIPEIFAWYNEWAQAGRLPTDEGENDSQELRKRFLASYNNTFRPGERADRCLACRKCLVACTQWTFRIPNEMEKVDRFVAHVREVYESRKS